MFGELPEGRIMIKTLELKSVLIDIQNIVSKKNGLIKKIGIFGSLARGNYNDDSDIDILIEYNAASELQMEHFTQFCELCNQMVDVLGSSYGRTVDIVHFEDDPCKSLQDENVVKEVLWL